MATVTSPKRVASARTKTPRRHSAPLRPPRRVSGPVGGRAAAAAAPRENHALRGRALALVRGLPDHSLIDRLVRGRAWIPVLGVLLAGIVATQVEILKLGASMGRAVEQTSTLQTRNEALQASVATLADDQRIERIAAAQGMAMPSPESLVFLTAHPGGQLRHALASIQAPDPSAFTSELAAQAAAAAALMPAAPATSSPTASTTPAGQTATTSATSPTLADPTSAAGASTSTAAASGQSVTPTTSAAAPTTSSAPVTSGASTPAVAATGAAGIAPAASSQPSGG